MMVESKKHIIINDLTTDQKSILSSLKTSTMQVILTCLFFIVCFEGLAATRTTISSGNWSNASTWQGGTIPVAGDDVVIDWGHIISPGTMNNLNVNNLTLRGGLTIPSNLTVAGTLTIEWDRSLQVGGNFSTAHGFTNNGSFSISGSSEITGNFTNNRPFSVGGNAIFNGNVNNTSTITIGGEANISGSLTNSGSFSVGTDLNIATNGSNTGTLSVPGNLDVSGTFTIGWGGALSVGKDAHFGDDVSNSGTINIEGSLDAEGSVLNNENCILDVSDNVTIVGNVDNKGTLATGGNLNITGDIAVGNGDLLVVNGDFIKDGDLTSTGNIVIAGDFTSNGGTTDLDQWNGDLYIFGNSTGCTGDCSLIQNFTDWIDVTPGLTYLDLVAGSLDGSGTFTVPDDITTIIIECWGGGGRGGGASNNNTYAGGGGGGAYSRSVLSVTPGTSYNFSVGAGSSSLSPGGDSWFGSTTTVMAKGGNSVADNTATGALGGLASESSGDTKFSGGNGANGIGGGTKTGGGGGSSAGISAIGFDGIGISGGIAPEGGGNGGDGGNEGSSGSAGSAPGGGGGGGARQNSGTISGGSGATGKVKVTFSTLPMAYFEETTTNLPELSATINIVVLLSASSSSVIEIPFTLSGTASGSGTDYTLLTASPLQIPAGNNSGTISFTIHPDALIEGDETIGIQLGTPNNAILGTPVFHTITIVDDDFSSQSLAVSAPSCCLGDQLTFTAEPPTGSCDDIQNFYFSNAPFSPSNTGTEITPENFNLVGGNCISNYTILSTGTWYFRYYYYKNPSQNGYSNQVTISASPLPQGSLSANGPFCDSGTGQLTFSASEGTGPFTIVYNDGTADRTATGVISGTAFNVFTNPVTTSTTYTLVSVADANCTRTSSFTGSSATITVERAQVDVSAMVSNPKCPDLDPDLEFDANNATYDPGASEVIFRISRVSPAGQSWSFSYELLVTDSELDSRFSQPEANPATPVSVDGSEENYDMIFYIVNKPGQTIDAELEISNVTAGVCDDDSNGTHSVQVAISPMPVVGSFN